MILRQIIDAFKLDPFGSTLYEKKKRDSEIIRHVADDPRPDYRTLRINRDFLPFIFKPAYDSMLKGYEKMMRAIPLPSRDGLRSEDIMLIHNAVLNDNPQLYYLSTEVSFTPGKQSRVIPGYIIDPDEKEVVDNQLDLVLRKIPITETDGCFRRERLVSDYISSRVKYGHGADEHRSHTIMGSLLDQIAVCDGISKGVSFLLNKLGVPCTTISGYLDGAGHSWNIIEIGGERYHLDVTNNGGALPDCYYNSTDEMMSKTHTLPFICGCSDSSVLFDNRYITIKRAELSPFLRGFFNSRDREVFFRVSDGLSKNIFETELNRAMTLVGGTIHCSYSSFESIGLFSINRKN